MAMTKSYSLSAGPCWRLQPMPVPPLVTFHRKHSVVGDHRWKKHACLYMCKHEQMGIYNLYIYMCKQNVLEHHR